MCFQPSYQVRYHFGIVWHSEFRIDGVSSVAPVTHATGEPLDLREPPATYGGGGRSPRSRSRAGKVWRISTAARRWARWASNKRSFLAYGPEAEEPTRLRAIQGFLHMFVHQFIMMNHTEMLRCVFSWHSATSRCKKCVWEQNKPIMSTRRTARNCSSQVFRV